MKKDLGRLEREVFEDERPDAQSPGEQEYDRIRDEQSLDPRGQLIAEDHPSITVLPGTFQNPFSTLEYSEKIASRPRNQTPFLTSRFRGAPLSLLG
jgi:hypothetical protein